METGVIVERDEIYIENKGNVYLLLDKPGEKDITKYGISREGRLIFFCGTS